MIKNSWKATRATDSHSKHAVFTPQPMVECVAPDLQCMLPGKKLPMLCPAPSSPCTPWQPAWPTGPLLRHPDPGPDPAPDPRVGPGLDPLPPRQPRPCRQQPGPPPRRRLADRPRQQPAGIGTPAPLPAGRWLWPWSWGFAAEQAPRLHRRGRWGSDGVWDG